mgnify:CR=1 FL=1
MYRIAKLGAALVYLVAGVLGLFLCIRWALGAAGVLGAVVAGVLFPLTLALVPCFYLMSDDMVRWIARIRNPSRSAETESGRQ